MGFSLQQFQSPMSIGLTHEKEEERQEIRGRMKLMPEYALNQREILSLERKLQLTESKERNEFKNLGNYSISPLDGLLSIFFSSYSQIISSISEES
jgi:hypothetical protein